MNAILSIIAASVSGICLFLSFTPFNISYLAWVALVPLFLLIAGKTAKRGFFLALICGIVFFVGIFNWILEVPGYTFLHHTILGLYLGSYFGFFGLAFCLISKQCGTVSALFAAPFLWTALEYIRANFFFLALPWGLLAHSQYQNPSIIQIASLTGAYGVGFLIVMVNAAVTAVILLLAFRMKKSGISSDQNLYRQTLTTVIAFAAVLIMFSLIYGRMTISKPITGEKIKLALVQGNIEQNKKWDRKYANFINQTYRDLTSTASKGLPDLIIWPETATPRAIDRDPDLYASIKQTAKKTGRYILIGSAHHQKFKGKKSNKGRYLNSAFIISPDKEAVRQRYDKIRLLPFGEYLPLKETIPWSYINVPDIGTYTPGDEFTLFNISDVKFGVTICWENIFPDMVRRFVRDGAQFIVNITNEAWFGKTAAPYQFLSMSVFRAVENHIYVVRCANTGVSCFIDPYGRIIDRVKDENDKDIFIRGVLTGSIVPQKTQTIYNRFGNWLVWGSFLFTFILLLVAVFRRLNEGDG